MAACVCILIIIIILIDACVFAVIASGHNSPAVNVACILKTVRVRYGNDSASREEADGFCPKALLVAAIGLHFDGVSRNQLNIEGVRVVRDGSDGAIHINVEVGGI